ncbi:hypothetical protein HY411_00740 [Candidatus Gottesmanbacteria bacterium]|nr:hypothetical protein [Candidatus Gottesmanbacteria bacterium]
MITDADVKKLKQAFATKDDFKAFATKDDLINELKPIKKGLRQLNRRYKETVLFFDKIVSHRHKRLDQLEETAGVEPPPYIPLFPVKN